MKCGLHMKLIIVKDSPEISISTLSNENLIGV